MDIELITNDEVYEIWPRGEEIIGSAIKKPILRFKARNHELASQVCEIIKRGNGFPLDMKGVEIL